MCIKTELLLLLAKLSFTFYACSFHNTVTMLLLPTVVRNGRGASSSSSSSSTGTEKQEQKEEEKYNYSYVCVNSCT